jgi:hypothetical protein
MVICTLCYLVEFHHDAVITQNNSVERFRYDKKKKGRVAGKALPFVFSYSTISNSNWSPEMVASG